MAHPRFKSIYLCEVLELLNDEEEYVRIEAIDILTDLLGKLDIADIENEYVKEVLRTAEADVEEIQFRLAEMLGRIVYALVPFDFHMKFKDPLLDFYRKMTNHKELKMRRLAAFNLPCFNSLYHGLDEFDLDFNELYLRFVREEDPQIIKAVAASIHEAFKLTSE
jgi:hypothetical protein